MKRTKDLLLAGALCLMLGFGAMPVQIGHALGELALQNPGFEAGSSNWTQTFGTTGATVTSALAYSGSKSLQLVDNSTTGAVGMESDKVSVTAGKTYKAKVQAYIQSGNAEIYLRYYDSNNQLVGSYNKPISGTVGQWNYLSVVGEAPAGAVKASVLLYSSKGNTGTVYYDDVVLQSAYLNLGDQLPIIQVMEGAIGKDSTGKAWLYTVTSGNPAQFHVIDVETEQVVRSLDLPGADGAWAVTVATDGLVYVGSYGPTAKMYKYVPGSSTLTDLGTPVAGQTLIGDLTPGQNGKVYGGTYPGGMVYKYETSSGFTQFGGQMQPGEETVRSLAYDETTKMLYSGIGDNAHLIKFDTATGAKTELLPLSYRSTEQYVYDMRLAGGKLFAKVTPSNELLVMNKTDGTVEDHFVIHSRGVTPLSPVDDKVYYTYNGLLYSYDISSKLRTDLGVDFKANIVGADFVKLNDPAYPGDTLVGLVGNRGTMFKYNLATGTWKTKDLPLPKQYSSVEKVKKGPDGNIYSGGFLSGAGYAVYNPVTESSVSFTGISQTEGIGTLGSKVYFGVYPGAKIYSRDTVNNPEGKVTQLFSLSSEQQDRPKALLGVEEVNKLYIGTAPISGVLGGTLTIYDPVTGTYDVRRNIVPNHSVISLAYKDGKVYGGTSSFGGGSASTGEPGRIFSFNTVTGQKEWDVSLGLGTAISALEVGPDGNLWGVAQGTFFVFNPSTRSVVYQTQAFNTSTRLGNASLVMGVDGYMYGLVGSDGTSDLFRVHPTTKELTILRSDIDGNSITRGNDGHLYFANGTALWRYEIQ
jgi:hypothetical protein